ncbi:MAG: hypothetical protein ACE5EL_06640, partial [Anaerolineae bacterium]
MTSALLETAAPPLTRSRFRFFGRDVVLETDEPRVAQDAARCYARFLLPWRGGSSGRNVRSEAAEPLVVRAMANGGSCAPSVQVGGRRLQLSNPTELSERAQLALVCAAAAHRHDRVVLHSGAAERNGQAILLVGPSGWGKTTVTAALVKQGWRYLSDEFAPITPDGHVHPFPRALRLVPPDGAEFHGRARTPASSTGSRARLKTTVDPEDLVADCIGAPGKLRAVFLLGGCRQGRRAVPGAR